jgi:hypothetical protein
VASRIPLVVSRNPLVVSRNPLVVSLSNHGRMGCDPFILRQTQDERGNGS